jgi:hypothetical protein
MIGNSAGFAMAKSPEKPPLSIVSGETTTIRPPRQLGQHGMALWNRVMAEYGIVDCGGVELLCLACQALDRAESLAEAIARDGPVVYSRAGVPKAHPACRDELANRAYVAKQLERLGVTVENVKLPGRPLGVRGSWQPVEIG